MATSVPSGVKCFACYGLSLSEAWKLSLLDQIAGRAPSMIGFSPSEGIVGTEITVSGENLTSATSVTVGGVAATFVVSGNDLIVTVPEGASTGPIVVTTPSGEATSATDLTVLDFPSGGTFSRASSATYDDDAGLVQTALTNVLRNGHYIDGEPYALLENQRTNVVQHNRNLSNAVWTQTDVTAAKDQTGVDGVSNSASSITATGANGTCLQAITIASLQRVTSAYVKRLTGAGTIEMTMNGGTTWVAVTVTASWTRVQIPALTIANPSVGFRLVTSGDAIAVDYVQCEDRLLVTTPIATAGASVSRAVDSLALRVPAKPETVVYETPDGKYVIYNSRDDIGRFQHTPTKSIQVWDGDKRNDITGKADLWGVRNGYTRAALESVGITTMAQLGAATGTLSLSLRGLTDCAGFEYSTNRTILELQLNQLSGSIPSGFGQLINLTRLFLQINQLSGSIPSGISQFANLTILQLHNNQFTQTDLENFIDDLWDNRVQLGANGCNIKLDGNPGSSGAKTTKASEINDLIAAGCSVTI